MMRFGHTHFAMAVALVALSLTGCPANECAYYNDCDDDFVCENGRCVEQAGSRNPTYTGGGDGGVSTPTTDSGTPIVEEDAGPPPPACPEGECCDTDEDGFIFCNGVDYPADSGPADCDDEAWHVQPGGYEYPSNGTDDNCNGLTDGEESPACACGFTNSANPEVYAAEDILHAMDICDDTLGSVSMEGAPEQFGIFGSFFTPSIGPRGGNCLVVLSSGRATGLCEGTTDQYCLDESLSGGATDPEGPDGSFFDPSPDVPDGGTAPPPPAENGTVYDLAQIHFEVTPPVNAKGLELEFMFISKEWPEYLCSTFNDTFYVIAEIEGVDDGEPTNIAFDPDARPVTVNVGYFEYPPEWTVDLGATPYGEAVGGGCVHGGVEMCELPEYCSIAGADVGYTGSGSGWLKARAPVPPGGGPIQITLSIHDEGDGIFDSMVALDRFRWLPTAPPVGAYKPPPPMAGEPQE